MKKPVSAMTLEEVVAAARKRARIEAETYEQQEIPALILRLCAEIEGAAPHSERTD